MRRFFEPKVMPSSLAPDIFTVYLSHHHEDALNLMTLAKKISAPNNEAYLCVYYDVNTEQYTPRYFQGNNQKITSKPCSLNEIFQLIEQLGINLNPTTFKLCCHANLGNKNANEVSHSVHTFVTYLMPHVLYLFTENNQGLADAALYLSGQPSHFGYHRDPEHFSISGHIATQDDLESIHFNSLFREPTFTQEASHHKNQLDIYIFNRRTRMKMNLLAREVSKFASRSSLVICYDSDEENFQVRATQYFYLREHMDNGAVGLRCPTEQLNLKQLLAFISRLTSHFYLRNSIRLCVSTSLEPDALTITPLVRMLVDGVKPRILHLLVPDRRVNALAREYLSRKKTKSALKLPPEVILGNKMYESKISTDLTCQEFDNVRALFNKVYYIPRVKIKPERHVLFSSFFCCYRQTAAIETTDILNNDVSIQAPDRQLS